jgi:hypothetical protein
MLIETGDSKEPNEVLNAKRPRRPWHAITIVTSGMPCQAALALRGKRILSSEAPRLPLGECDGARCNCKYRHYDDRRNVPRRAEEKGAPRARVTVVDRRGKRGRRATD